MVHTKQASASAAAMITHSSAPSMHRKSRPTPVRMLRPGASVVVALSVSVSWLLGRVFAAPGRAGVRINGAADPQSTAPASSLIAERAACSPREIRAGLSPLSRLTPLARRSATEVRASPPSPHVPRFMGLVWRSFACACLPNPGVPWLPGVIATARCDTRPCVTARVKPGSLRSMSRRAARTDRCGSHGSEEAPVWQRWALATPDTNCVPTRERSGT